jgi:hypothetical protein
LWYLPVVIPASLHKAIDASVIGACNPFLRMSSASSYSSASDMSGNGSAAEWTSRWSRQLNGARNSDAIVDLGFKFYRLEGWRLAMWKLICHSRSYALQWFRGATVTISAGAGLQICAMVLTISAASAVLTISAPAGDAHMLLLRLVMTYIFVAAQSALVGRAETKHKWIYSKLLGCM